MSVARSDQLQADVFAVVTAAVAAYGLAVYDYAPTSPPDEFIRLEGFDVNSGDSKFAEMARHGFEIHHFAAPTSTGTYTRGKTRSKLVLGAIHAAIMAATLAGSRAVHEYLMVDEDMDGTTAHGVSRYNIFLA